MRPVTHVVMHTSASWNPRHGVIYPTAKDIDAMHRARGWSGIGYHWVVGKNGEVQKGRDESVPGAHVAGFNRTTVGVCVTGHGDHKAWTPEQWESAVDLVAKVLLRHGIEDEFRRNPMRVLGHREVGKFRQGLARIVSQVLGREVQAPPDPLKSCPGSMVDMRVFRQDVAKRLFGPVTG